MKYKMTHRDFFFKILDILDEHNIKYWAFCGTLISVIREGDFLPSDYKDTDIAIDDADYETVKELLKATTLPLVIRRKELTIYSKNKNYKVDIFAMEKQNKNYFLYSYRPNKINGQWNEEWRVVYPYELFFPLKKKRFLGRYINVPNKYEKILEIHYTKKWKIPDPNWDSLNPPHIDKSYKPLGVIVVNFLRVEQTKHTIISLLKNFPNCRIYLGDQDNSKDLKIFANNYETVNHYKLPYDCGISASRNFLINKIREPFIMWIDNDFEFTEDNGIQESMDLLSEKNDIGVVGGLLYKEGKEQHYERHMLYDEKLGILVYIPLALTEPKALYFRKNLYYYSDITLNFCIAKKEVFDDIKIRWTESLKSKYEHSSWFLKLKLYSQYKVVYFPVLKAIHNHIDSPKYRKFRYRKNANVEFANLWKLKMNFTIGGGREIYVGDKNFTKVDKISEYKKEVYINEPQIEVSKMKQKEIAIIIPSFMRWQKTVKEIESIEKNIDDGWYQIYVGDQWKEDKEKDKAFDNLKEKGHKIIKLPYNCGLSYARNKLVEISKEPFILVIDNDFLFTKDTKLDYFMQLLLKEKNIGACGGVLIDNPPRSPYTHHFLWDKNNHKFYYLKTNPKFNNYKAGFLQPELRYLYSESILNFFLAKREFLEDIKWDNNLPMSEHTDFMYRASKSKWKIVFTKDVEVIHQQRDKKNNFEYGKFRTWETEGSNANIGWKRFLKKYNLNGVNDVITLQIGKIIPDIKTKEPSIINPSKSTNPINAKYIVRNLKIINNLKRNDIAVCLLKSSCRMTVVSKNINTEKLYLGVDDINKAKRVANKSYIKYYPLPSKTKAWNCNGVDFLVPFPVVEYLRNLYGKHWKEI